MYTRSYTEDVGEILIPEKYGGTSFVQGPSRDAPGELGDGGKNPWEKQDIHTSEDESKEESAPTSASPTKSAIPTFLSGIFKNGSFGLQKIGKEEILILATAAFLLFSKEGDKECAIMLLLLLFLG